MKYASPPLSFICSITNCGSSRSSLSILSGANKLIISGAPIVIEFWPYGLKRNDLWKKMQEIIKKFKFFSDISEDAFRIKEINQENIKKLFSGWDEEEPSKHALFTDLLLLSIK